MDIEEIAAGYPAGCAEVGVVVVVKPQRRKGRQVFKDF